MYVVPVVSDHNLCSTDVLDYAPYNQWHYITVHLICGSSSVKHIGSFKGILSSTPVELTDGVEDIDTAFMEIGPVGAVVEVAVPVVGVHNFLLESRWSSI